MILRHAFIPPDNTRLAHLCGPLDEHLRRIESALGVRISRRNESFRVEGPRAAAESAVALLQSFYPRAARPIPQETLQLALVSAQRGEAAPDPAEDPDALVLRTRRSDLAGRTPNQVLYLRNILAHDLSFGIGPAGTGKTYLAVAAAVKALRTGAVRRIVLTRPVVEAGERLGFLPGDVQQKLNPYTRPLYDAFYDMLGFEDVQRMEEHGIIEVAPLAFMRGRTLANAFVVLDEGQNATVPQMKMFLTRLGERSKMIITGDVTQTDLPSNRISGLLHAEKILEGISGVSICHFARNDVVRHPVVQEILKAYTQDEEANGPAEEAWDGRGQEKRRDAPQRFPRRD